MTPSMTAMTGFAAPARPRGRLLRWCQLAALAALAALALLPALSRAAECPPPAAGLSEDDVRVGMRDARDHGFLWRLTRDGHASWLYGTLHVAQRDWMFPGPQTLAALRAAQTVALELDIADPDILARTQRAIQRRADEPPLPAAVAARLAAQTRASCLPDEALAGLRPEMRAMTLVVSAGRRIGLEPAYGIDAFLAGIGHGMQKDVRSLETPEDQIHLLVSDDPAEIVQNVTDMLDELARGNTEAQLERLSAVWRDGALADLADYPRWCDCMNTPRDKANFARLVDARNAAMAERVAAWHAGGRSLFVAVGSLHMVGAQGLPRLLAAKGFTVERVAFGASAAQP